jgi:hypothetical protein
MLRAFSPCVPYAGQGHYFFAGEVDFEWPFCLAVPLPFVKSADGNYASLAFDHLTEKVAFENGLAPRVYR